MSKIFMVEEVFNNWGMKDVVNGPFTDTEVVEVFSNRVAAEKWIEEHFTSFVNHDPTFCDLVIVEKEVLDDDDTTKQIIDDVWINAWISNDLSTIGISGFVRFKTIEYVYFNKVDKKYYIRTHVPRTINSRKSLVDFLKKKVKENC